MSQYNLAKDRLNAITWVNEPQPTPYPSQELKFQGVSGPDFICMRLNMSRYEVATRQLELISVLSDIEGQVGVVIRTPGAGLQILRDEVGLFPSDGLVTQLRLMLK
jgi:hypothetical protein